MFWKEAYESGTKIDNIINVSNYNNDIKDIGEISLLIDKGRGETDWYIFRDQRHFGPFSYDKITELIELGAVNLHHHVWRPGFDDWTEISKIDELASYFKDNEEQKKLEDTEFEFSLKQSIEKNVKFDEQETAVRVAEIPSLELEKINRYKKVNLYLTGALSLIVLVSLGFYLLSNSTTESFRNLNSYQKTKLTNISKTKVNAGDVRFDGFLSALSAGDPVFVFASNLKESTSVTYSLIGVRDTLIGQHRLKISDTVKSDGIFESKPLRLKNGKFIPAGEYYVNVSCSDCIDKTLLKKKVKYFPMGETAYAKDLKVYKTKIFESKKLEISELENIILTVEKQISRTKSSYSKIKGRQSWNNFSKSWLTVQNDLVGLFAQLDKAAMKDKIYHLSAYMSLKDLVKQTFELHVNQNIKFDKNIKAKTAAAAKIASLSSVVDLNLISLKNEVKSANLEIQKEATGFKNI